MLVTEAAPWPPGTDDEEPGVPEARALFGWPESSRSGLLASGVEGDDATAHEDDEDEERPLLPGGAPFPLLLLLLLAVLLWWWWWWFLDEWCDEAADEVRGGPRDCSGPGGVAGEAAMPAPPARRSCILGLTNRL